MNQTAMKTGTDKARCMECGAPLIPGDGRTDRKFCSVSCKNSYHNRNSEPFREYRMRILRRLDRNHSILSGILGMGRSSLGLAEAMAMGFSPTVYTSGNKKGKHVEYTCFDIRYRISENRLWAVEKVIISFFADP